MSDRTLWTQLYSANPSLSPYQSIDFVRQYLKTVKMGKRRALLRNDILCVHLENAEIICPLAVDKRKKEVFLLGDFSSVGYCDLVYGPNTTDEQFDAVVDALKARYSGYAFRFNKVNENSMFYAYLCRRTESIFPTECACVFPGNDDEAYYKSLSKNARQNIRTAYNRLNRDQKSWELCIISGDERLTNKQKDAISSVYASRMQVKLGKEALPYPVLFAVQRFFNPISRALNRLNSKFHALLYIDGKLAACLSGFYNCDGSRIVVPHLSMNNKFDFYDPGIVLLRETAKYLCTQHPNTALDLSRGSEKYKYTMGGKTHFNYSFVL